jgi:hypothetical protein
MKRVGATSVDQLPLFATDDLIGGALLGADRVQEWRQIAPLLETRGLPKVDQVMGGRYVPAVVGLLQSSIWPRSCWQSAARTRRCGEF